MTVHRCPLPGRESSARAWRCPECGADYVWSKRMVQRRVHEGWSRTFSTLGPARARAGTDEEFDRWFNRAAVATVAFGVISFVVVIALIVWIVLRVTA